MIVGSEDIPLSAQNLTLQASPAGQQIQLRWQDVAGAQGTYSLERSTNRQDFSTLTTVAVGQPLQYDDATVLPQTPYYYRVQKTDLHGRITFSNLVQAQIGQSRSGVRISVSPNPAQDLVNIQIESPREETAQLEVFNPLGQRIIQQSLSLGVGTQTLPLELTGLSAGIDTVQLTLGDGTYHTTRVLKR